MSSRRNPANARIVILSPDTDALVLAVTNHHHLLRNTSVYTVSGVIDVDKSPLLVLLADNGQRHYLHYMHFQELIQLDKLGKATWLNIFMKYGSDKIGALEQLLIANETSAQQLAMLASFVCEV